MSTREGGLVPRAPGSGAAPSPAERPALLLALLLGGLAAAAPGPLTAQDPPREHIVDLTDDGAQQPTGADRLVRRWFENLDIYGFGAVGYLDSGRLGTRPDGGFLIKEASLFFDAEVWARTSFFVELQVNRLGRDDDLLVRTGEVHAHFRDVLADELGEGALGVKIGRIDIPFGEEYLWQDAVDNPLITQSAAFPYGFDEGVLLYGRVAGVGWILSVTDGNEARSKEDGTSKAMNAKIHGEPLAGLRLSASAMRNGLAGESAIEFGGSHIEPVDTSPSARVDGTLYELDAGYRADGVGGLNLAFGQAHVSDDAPGFDRDLSWGMVEARWDVTDRIYLIGRASEIGTYSDSAGYHFDGKILAGGNQAHGYDSKRLQRLSLGAGYAPNPMLTAKVEVGRDRFWLVDGAGPAENGDDRIFFGLELAMRF